MGSVIKMAAGGTGGTQNAVAQLDVPMGTELLGVQWSVNHDMDADAEFLYAQLSFRSTFASTNDDRGIISEVSAQAALLTSGVYPNAINQYVSLPEVPLMGGERLFINLFASAGLVSNVVVLLHLSSDLDKPSIRRR